MCRPWVIVLTCALAWGCSQKDPGDDSGKPGQDSGPDDDSGPGVPVAEDYYPMVVGSTLTYRHSGSGTPWNDETKISATTFNGKDAFLSEGAPDSKGETSKNVIVRIGTQLLRAHKEELKAGVLQGIVEYEPGFIRYDSVWADAKDGFSQMIGYKRVEKTASGNVIGEDDREHTFTLEASSDSVTVPAGTFDDCLRVRRVRVRGNAANAVDDDDKVFWFCAGIGKVKELSEIGAGTEELVSCKIPGGLCP